MKVTVDAQVLQVLLWYDQPEIILLKVSAAEYVLAVSSALSGNDEFSFVGAGMSLSRVEDYQQEKFDLRYALAHANLRRYYTFNFRGVEDKVELQRLVKTSDVISASLPESGFFARDHDDIKIIQHRMPDAIEKFNVDGGWELGEFSKFYSQIEDIYYIFNDIDLYQSPNVSIRTKETISKAFDRSWGGGGSYVAFYDSIANDNDHIAPLRVSGIEYHSPGYVALRAKKKPFDNIITLLQAYAENGAETRKAFNALNRFMSFSGMLRADVDSAILTSVVKEELLKLSNILAECMPGINFSTLLDMSNGDYIVAAKVLKSIFNRVKRLYGFFEQGRVAYEGLDTSALVNED
jgi:hypothetical protein